MKKLLPGIFFLLLWEYWTFGDSERRFLFAAPSLVGAVALDEFRHPEIYLHLGITAYEALLGFFLGSLLGCAFGLLLWLRRGVAEYSRPYVVFLGSIPIFSIAPMLIIWFGTGILSKVVMAGFSVFFVTLAQVYDGARALSRERLVLPQSLGVSSGQIARYVIFPGSLRWVLSALRMNVSLALVGAFIGEFVSSEIGVGHYILQAGSLFDMPRVLFGVTLLALVALTLSAGIDLLERKTVGRGR